VRSLKKKSQWIVSEDEVRAEKGIVEGEESEDDDDG
jgi:hypothetical protein